MRAITLVAAVAVALASTTQYRIMRQLNSIELQLQQIRAAPSEASTARPRPVGALPAQPLSLEGAAIKGSLAAPLAIIVYSDFQCPSCARFAKTSFRELDKEYISKGKVLIAFRHLPLTRIHSQALPAATAASCAGRQGKFWEMHDRLFTAGQELTNASFPALARDLRLDTLAFDQCLTQEGPAVVQRDVELAGSLQVTGTPTFLIGAIDSQRQVLVTQRFSGNQPISRFKAALDPLLAKSALD